MLTYDQPTPDYPMVRHQGARARCDGFVYNRLKWPDCPKCLATAHDRYALFCQDCYSPRFAAYRSESCSDCGSGDMTVVASP